MCVALIRVKEASVHMHPFPPSLFSSWTVVEAATGALLRSPSVAVHITTYFVVTFEKKMSQC